MPQRWVSLLLIASLMLLGSCRQDLSRAEMPTTTPAHLIDADFDDAHLRLPSHHVIINPIELPDLEDLRIIATSLDTETDTSLSPHGVLPNATGTVAFVRHNPNLSANPWTVHLMDQAADVTTMVYGGRREIDSVAVSADANVLLLAMRRTIDTSGDFEIYRVTLDADENVVERLTVTPYDERNVSMSGDASVLVWEGEDGDGKRAVFVREGDTEAHLALALEQYQPSISADGNTIALVRTLANGNPRVVRYEREGNTYQVLWGQTAPVTLSHPSVSADGSRVAFLEYRPPGTAPSERQLVRYLDTLTQTVTNAVGVQLTDGPRIAHPHLAADGDHLAYAWRQGDAWNVFTRRVSTRETQRIAVSMPPTTNHAPYWAMSAPAEAAVLGVTILEGDQGIGVNGEVQLTAEVEAEGGASTTVSWSSSAVGVATVTPSGLVTGVAAGEAIITATSDFDPSKSDSVTITVTDDPPDAMLLTVDTTASAGRTVTLPLRGSVDATVHWGDGNVTGTTFAGDLSHTYAVEGSYQIEITGSLTQFGSGPDAYEHAEKLITVTSWDGLGLTSLAGAFRDAVNLMTVPTTLPATVTDLSHTFRGATNFNGPIGAWNTSNVTNMSFTFAGAAGFNRDIGAWNTSNVTNMSIMFYDATAFNQPIGSWNVSNVTTMAFMFGNATAFNQPIGDWNVSNVTDMGYMFRSAAAFDQPIGDWDVSNVTIMNSMFRGATAFNQPIGDWDVANVTNMAFMFNGAAAFNQDLSDWCVYRITAEPHDFATGATSWVLPKPGWGTCPPNMMVLSIDTFLAAGTTMTLPLRGEVDVTVAWGDGNFTTATASGDVTHAYTGEGNYTITISGTLTEYGGFVGGRDMLTGVSSWGDLGLTNLSSAFTGASNLTTVPATLPPTVTNLYQMFRGATAFNQYIGDWDTSNVTTMEAMFRDATSFNQHIGNWDTTNVTSMRWMFRGATSFNQPIGNWNTTNVTTMVNVFRDATIFNQPIGNWDTTNAVSMRSMFQGAFNFNQPIGNWNTTNVTNMRSMFNGATHFSQPIGNWNTANVTDMGLMFQGVDAFDQPIANWNTSNVTTMEAMFHGATNFNQPIGNWNTANVTNMFSMFKWAEYFNQPIGSWNTANVAAMTEMFMNAGAFNQDLSGWCVSWFSSAPTNFDAGATSWVLRRPVWGTCP